MIKKFSNTTIDGDTAMHLLSCSYIEIYSKNKDGSEGQIITGKPKELLAKYADGDDLKAKKFFHAVYNYIPQGRVLYFDEGTNRLEVFKARLF
jgi:hypothetical protein